jgi:hypothetical protein
MSYHTIFVTNHHQGRETESAATLVGLTTRLMATTFSFNSRSPALTLFTLIFAIISI